MNGAPKNSATCSARSKRRRCSSKSSWMPTLPIGEPTDDIAMPCSASMPRTVSSRASSRSSTLVPHALRNSMWPMPSSPSTRH